ncbi:amino acid permease [Candidatus Babeliales bacterium]|nr:amino acid permease [Candidatus Babeliales bacterium]
MNNASSNNKISLLAVTAVGINAMIGAGVLAIPIMLANQVGPAGIISAFFSILFVLFIGLSLGRAAGIYPGSGWNYLYPSKWAGHFVGMISSFLYIFGIIVAMGFLVQQVGVWSHMFIPFVSPTILSVVIFLILMFLVLYGAHASSLSQYVIAFFVLLPLTLTAIYCWFHFDSRLLTPFMPYGAISLLKTGPSILFAFFGFESIASLYSIVENPRRNIPKAFMLSILTVGILYSLFFFGILFAIPSQYFVGGLNDTIANVLSKFFSGARFLSVSLLIGAFFGIIGTLHSMLWSVSVLFSGVLKRSRSSFIKLLLAKNIWNEKVAVLVTSTLILLSFFFFLAEKLIAMTALFIVPSYILSIMSLLFIKKEWKSGQNFITMCAFLGGLLMIYFALQSAIPALLSFF